MPAPHLPLEIWTHVSIFLDSESLSSLSQVSTMFHRICTDESHFQRMVPTVRNYYKHPMQLFRRLRALYHPPNRCISIMGTAQFDVLGTIQDNLLLVDEVNLIATSFPSGVTFNILHIFDEPDSFLQPFQRMSKYLQTVYTALPGGHIAVVHRPQPSRLVVQDLLENRTLTWKIKRDECVSDRRIVDGSSIAPAGNNGEWVAYYSSEKCVTVFNWQSGQHVRDITTEREEPKLMMGECPAIDGMSVVGVLSERRIGSLTEINCHAFDNDDSLPFPAKFLIPNENIAEVVLRSMDKRTHVLIMRTLGAEDPTQQDFLAYRVDRGLQHMWIGRLMRNSQFQYPELRENGRVNVLVLYRQGLSGG